MGSRIVGTGGYLPENRVDNAFFSEVAEKRYSEELSDLFDGCQSRRHASPDESTIYMGKMAAEMALKDSETSPDEIDYVLWSAVMGDYCDSEDAGRCMRELGIKNAAHWSLRMACSSFLPMFSAADALIRSGRAKKVLVIAVANWVNRVVDKTKDYSLLGDGAAAFVFERSEQDSLISIHEQTYTPMADMVTLPSPWRTQSVEKLVFQKSPEIRSFIMDGKGLEPARKCVLEGRKKGFQANWSIFSQIGIRPMDTWSHLLELDPEINLRTLPFTGHLSLANHPYVFHHFTKIDPKIKRGDVVLFFGLAAAGYTCGILWKY